MNKEIVENLISDFNHHNLVTLFRNKTRSFKHNPEEVVRFNDEFFEGCTLLGSFETTDDKLEMLVFTAKTKHELSERSGKKRQYDLGKKILKEQLRYSGGFFVFYDDRGDFRFSLICDIPLPGGKVRFSNFKRYTYFVSREQTNKTFIRQISLAEFTSLSKIIEAFSVDKVRAEFYHEIACWYFWAMDKVKFPDDYKYSANPAKDAEIRNSTNLIRLLTRIIFIWFIKEKKLIPASLFDVKELKRIVKDFYTGKEASNYYNAVLQNLFFGTLNQKMNERAFAREGDFSQNQKEYGVKNLYRYAQKFAIPPEEAIALFKDIPFLNGGLFDCLDKEDETGKVIYIDGFSRNPRKQAIISDYLFFQADEEKVNLSVYEMGKDKTVRGLIEILKSYNFTIDESTPVDQEVALDPEMLGKVFEELLASYNPETATTARKATGSFYTPREIVDYMVQQSVKHYLLSNTQLDEATIEKLIAFSDDAPDLSEDQKKQIIELVDNIKILDPACGSGAFPMGILHQLVFILQKLDPDNKVWYEVQYNKALEETQKAFKHSDKSEREELLKEINESFDEHINYPDYARKLYLIENCIYGVDIQPIAIQISKLRFFISLVIDQKIDSRKENFGIRPLPNLETKFVGANTLIGLGRPQQLTIRNASIDEKENELKELRHQYYTAKTRKEKINFQCKDKELRKEIAGQLKAEGWESRSAEQIASFDPYDQNSSADWFDPEWMFGVTEGFDIVIGNPPYIQLQKAYSGKLKYADLYKDQHYETFDRTGDIYCLFYEKGLQLLKQRGHLCYITSNKWMRAGYGEKLRQFFARHNPVLLIDLGPGVFENATVDTNILLIQKTKSTTSIPAGGKSITSIPAGEIYEFFSPYNEIEIYRGNLPHWQQKNVWYFITFRLADSIPEHAKEKIKAEREMWLKKHKDKDLSLLSKEEKIEYFRLFTKRIEELLDSGYGECILKDSKVSKIVADALLHFNNERYILDEWVIMPNHVHVLVKPIGNYSITDILHSWKSYTANEINKLLGRKGQVWMHESYDHIVRNEKAFEAIRKYIRNNPKGKSTTSIPAGGKSADGSTIQSRDALGTFRLRALTLQRQNGDVDIDRQVKENAVILDKLSGEAWFIGNDAEQRLKEKIESIGKPLKDWDVKIYRGVLTGLNEAFIITTEKRNEILANCSVADASCIGGLNERQRTEAIIKPILRGRDIKRYYYEWAGLWVIFIPWHFPLHEDLSIQGASEKAEIEFEKQFPSVYNHLSMSFS